MFNPFKNLLIIFALLSSMTVGAQNIERTTNYKGGVVKITSAEKIFSGCQIRLCNYTDSKGGITYGLEVDLTDRTNHVCEGNNLTIHFKDGSRITVSNLWDTKAEVKHESYVQSYDHTVTDFVPVYDAWLDAVYSAPITRHYTEHVPVDNVTTFARLYYILTPAQIEKIISSKIKDVTIVTDENTIVKKARPFSEAVSELYEVVRGDD